MPLPQYTHSPPKNRHASAISSSVGCGSTTARSDRRIMFFANDGENRLATLPPPSVDPVTRRVLPSSKVDDCAVVLDLRAADQAVVLVVTAALRLDREFPESCRVDRVQHPTLGSLLPVHERRDPCQCGACDNGRGASLDY